MPHPQSRRAPRTLTMLVVLLFAALVAAPHTAGADDEKKKPRDGFDFGNKGETGGDGEAEAPRQNPFRRGSGDENLTPIQREIKQLARWPARKAQLAAEALFLRGAEAVPYLVLALKSGDPAVAPGVATVLGKIGSEEHVHPILSAAAVRANGHRADDFFKAAYTLSPKATKHWLIGFLPLSDRPMFRALAASFLAKKVGPEDKDRVLGLLESNKSAVRAAGLQLLGAVDVKDGPERMLQALSDYSPTVARKAALLVSLRMDETMAKRVNELTREGDARERAYAGLALVEAMRGGGGNVFEPATLAELSGRRGLMHPEKLSRASAAVALAYGALDTNDGALSRMLDSTVIDVLVDAIGGAHYRDYASFMEPVFSALKRLSGRVDIADTAVGWARWWQVNKGTFRARRPLREITPVDLPRAFVAFESVESSGRRTAAEFVSVDGLYRDGALLLTAGAFEALVNALEDAGLFEAEDRGQPRADEHISAALGLGDQRKRMILTPTDELEFSRLKMRFLSVIEANIWQRYRDADKSGDARAWWEANNLAMTEASLDESATMLASHIVYAFDDLPDEEARQEALFRLVDMDAQLSRTQMKVLASALTAVPTFGDLEADGLAWIINRADDEVRESIISSMSERTERRAHIILADLLAQGGVDRVREAFADPRPGMRMAAARAARTIIASPASSSLDADALSALADRLRGGLEVLAVDDDEGVAVQALIGLAYLGAQDVASKLERLYKGGNLSVKLAVTEALGVLPGSDGHAMLSFVLSEERGQGSGDLRAAALQSLASSNHPSAVRLLTFYLLNDPDTTVRVAAGDVLADMGTPEARFSVVDALVRTDIDVSLRARLVDVLGRFEGEVVRTMLLRYLSDKDFEVVAAAALRAADHNLARSVPALVNLLRKGEGNQRVQARRALENVSSRRFDVEGYSIVAERYEQWFDANSEGDWRVWLRAALKDKGYDTGPIAAYARGEASLDGVPLLIRVLRDPDPILRRNASMALREITGVSYGEAERGMSARDAARLSELWARWWDVEGRRAAAGGGSGDK